MPLPPIAFLGTKRVSRWRTALRGPVGARVLLDEVEDVWGGMYLLESVTVIVDERELGLDALVWRTEIE